MCQRIVVHFVVYLLCTAMKVISRPICTYCWSAQYVMMLSINRFHCDFGWKSIRFGPVIDFTDFENVHTPSVTPVSLNSVT